MKKHKAKIIAGVVILAALVAAFVYGGNYNSRDYSNPSTRAALTGEREVGYGQAQDNPTDAVGLEESGAAPPTGDAGSVSEMPGFEGDAIDAPSHSPSPSPAADEAGNDADVTPPVLPQPGGEPAEENATLTASPTNEPPTEPNPNMEIDTEMIKDKYQTDTVPEGKPQPVEPEDVIIGDGAFTVTLTIRCDTILDNMNLLDREKHELIPGDGVIFPVTTVTAYEGESVFNVTQRETRRIRMHMEFRNTPIYNSSYIIGINNLYEFDAGELSGWRYSVNGWFPNYGCSRYQVQPGDVIQWHYTCDLGRDLGQSEIEQNQDE
ncbi:MAG: DUF4430 domain-containing protein [Oscillospiraceae bacterium]|nr:DUF4430 domain-containing protein [Oscillospiraceae bacterium]